MSKEEAAGSGPSGTLALVGRPNVGKSTLFNRLCGCWDALVHDRPCLTRDRRYGKAQRIAPSVWAIDTGGLLDESFAGEGVSKQVEYALYEADLIVMLVDARDGITVVDRVIADDLRPRGLQTIVVVNKIDGLSFAERNSVLSEATALGLGECFAVSARKAQGINDISAFVWNVFPPAQFEETHSGIPVAIVGRPNVGKSTLVNLLVDNDRCIVSDVPGTTRDAVDVPVTHDGKDYLFIDTAGLRRRRGVKDTIEKFSIIQSLKALERAHVALILIDAREGIVEQDLRIISYAEDAGTGLLLLVNKWDGLSPESKRKVRNEIQRRLRFARWIQVRYISALKNIGVTKLFTEIDRIDQVGAFNVATPELNNVLQRAIQEQPLPMAHGRQIKLRYVHKVGDYPPRLLIHGNKTDSIPSSYTRYLERAFRNAFRLTSTPLELSYRTGDNPFEHKKNKLTEHQLWKRRRLIQHRKSRS